MPRDDWAKARAIDAAKRSKRREPPKQRGHKRRAITSKRQSWLQAIFSATNAADLTAIARSVQVLANAGKVSAEQYQRIVAAGRKRRQQLTQSPSTKAEGSRPTC